MSINDSTELISSVLGGEVIDADTAKEMRRRLFEDETLQELNTYESVVDLFDSSEVTLDEIDAYGSGFEILQDKDLLVGKAFVIVEWIFNTSQQFGSEFVSAFIMTKEKDEETGLPHKYIINDGSAFGIYRQLLNVTGSRMRKGRGMVRAGLLCPRGLRRRTFTTTQNINGVDKEIEAVAYNLA